MYPVICVELCGCMLYFIQMLWQAEQNVSSSYKQIFQPLHIFK